MRWEWQIAISAIVVGEITCASLFGWKGFAGMAIGLGATWFNSWALWAIIKLLGATAKESQSTKGGVVLIVTAFLLKLPILIGLGLFTRMIGGQALPCFVAGLGMVYFALIGWACAHS